VGTTEIVTCKDMQLRTDLVQVK